MLAAVLVTACPSGELANGFACSITIPFIVLLPFVVLLLSLLGHGILLSVSLYFLPSISFSLEARASSGRARKAWFVLELRSLENGRKAPPFLGLLSRASLGPTLKFISVSFGDEVTVACGLVPSPPWLHNWAEVIQFALSETLLEVFSVPSEDEFFKGMNSSRTGFGP